MALVLVLDFSDSLAELANDDARILIWNSYVGVWTRVRIRLVSILPRITFEVRRVAIHFTIFTFILLVTFDVVAVPLADSAAPFDALFTVLLND